MPSALTPFDGFDLRVVTGADLPLLARWHSDPQVYEWWEGRPLTEREVLAEYIDNDEPVTRCLVHLEGRPVGYLQFFRYEVAARRAAVRLEEGEDAWGIDLFLAEEADRGRGLGTRLLVGTLARLAEQRDASLVLIDPHLDNPRAIACYRQAGFVPQRVLPAHEEQAGVPKDALLMAWRPPGGAGLAEAAGASQAVRRMTNDAPAPETPLSTSPRLDQFRRVARWVILASVFLNALLGIWAVAGNLGEVESRILLTSLLVTACGAVAVACSAAIPERRLGPVWVPVAGIVIAVVAFCLVIASLWQDFRPAALWRTGATLVVVAVGVAFAALLSGVNLQGRDRRLVPTAYVLAGAAGAFLITVIWGFRAGEAWRLFGVVAVLLAATTLAAPIAARLRPAREGPPPVRHCPYCGGAIAGAGHRVVSCPSCGRRFRVEDR
ncbi:MAG TPA: GNAT family N-acetyltransferase [Acidimicrobiia bacterium]|nr:GNAT family N-acetyltransferase [Acidimicrobiia bacterium]